MKCKKIKYRSQEQAIVGNSRTRRRYGEMEPYWHEPCRAWHLGHPAGSWATP